MARISAQLSVYPLRQPRLSPAIDEAVRICRARGLEIEIGPMSTWVSGDDDIVFTALREAFRSVASAGEVIMVVTLSNACPAAGAAMGD
jgi:uncharacterized protein YqgV (UPF0045/DUF77 family)